MHKVFIGIGGNTGNKQENFQKVHILIENELGKILSGSSIYESAAWGFHSKSKFWNQVLIIETGLIPELLLDKIKNAEKSFGRKQTKSRYTSRPMDIDILYFDDLILKTDKLEIPHPRMELRNFVLVPIAEIAPDKVHPILKLTSIQLLEHSVDKAEVKKVLLNPSF